MKWCEQIVKTDKHMPQNYWANTSNNQMIVRFADKADNRIREQLSEVIEGKSVWKHINQELTYNEIYEDPENLWSVLLMTGYLTVKQYKEYEYFEPWYPKKIIHFGIAFYKKYCRVLKTIN